MASISPAPQSQKSPKSAPASGGESFAALFEESLNRKEMRVGEVITAEVLSVDENWVVVNAGRTVRWWIVLDGFNDDELREDTQAFIAKLAHVLTSGAAKKLARSVECARTNRCGTNTSTT